MMAATENKFSNNIETKETSSESSPILEAQDKLDSCEHYFIFWLGASKLDQNHLETLAEDLKDPNIESSETEKPEKHNEAVEKDETVNTNTKDEGSEKKPESKSKEKTKSNGKANDASDSHKSAESDDDDDPFSDQTSIYNMNLQRAASLIIQCFLNIHFGDIDLAKKAFARCTNFIELLTQSNNSLEKFVLGFDFLKHLLEIHLKLKENSHDVIEQVFSPSFGHIDELHDKGKAMIYVTKWKFLELTEDRKLDSLDALRNVARLDDSNCHWQYVLCMRIRFLRRESNQSSSCPDEEEIQASIASFQMSAKIGGTSHAMGRAGLSQTISEILRYRLVNKCPNVPISFGELTFDSNEAIIKYLKREARNALTRFPRICFSEFMRYSEIFSSALPHEHRNYEIAILCMAFCLRIMPKNSKANHKMGVLYLVGDEDIKEAIPFFRKAVQFEPKNYPAWMDLISSLLQSHTENDDELQSIFKAIYDKSWLEKQTVSLKFLNGCHLFMKGEKNAAIDVWLSMYNSFDDPDHREQGQFLLLSGRKRRYCWPHTEMQLEEVEIALNERIQSTDSFDMANKGLNALKEEIASAIRPVRDRQNTQDVFGARPMTLTRSNVENNNQWRQLNTTNTEGSQWRKSNRNTSATSDSRWRQSNSDNRNYYNRNGNNDSSRYYAMQRPRTPSPKSWRK